MATLYLAQLTKLFCETRRAPELSNKGFPEDHLFLFK